MFGSSFGAGGIANARGSSLLDVNSSSAWNLGGPSSTTMGGAAGLKKRDRFRDTKKGASMLSVPFSKSRKVVLQQDPTSFSQDMDMIEHKADEDICFKCQQGGGENWV